MQRRADSPRSLISASSMEWDLSGWLASLASPSQRLRITSNGTLSGYLRCEATLSKRLKMHAHAATLLQCMDADVICRNLMAPTVGLVLKLNALRSIPQSREVLPT